LAVPETKIKAATSARAASHATGSGPARADLAVAVTCSTRRPNAAADSRFPRISGQPAKAKALGEFIAYAQRHAGVAFLRKDAIARWALEQKGVPAAA
jgi:hypothetical protein